MSEPDYELLGSGYVRILNPACLPELIAALLRSHPEAHRVELVASNIPGIYAIAPLPERATDFWLSRDPVSGRDVLYMVNLSHEFDGL